jgi:hypothetical protein
MCRIRKRLTAHGGETFDAPTEWLNWYSSGERKKREEEIAPYIAPPQKEKDEKFGGFRL